jgi:hypothetical protein
MKDKVNEGAVDDGRVTSRRERNVPGKADFLAICRAVLYGERRNDGEVVCLMGINCPLFDTLVLPPPVWRAHQVVYEAAG